MSEHVVEVVPYDPTWPERFERERALLEAAVSPWMAGPIQHVGSTAVPGLCAKPVIDIMIPVHALAGSEPAIGPVEALGYNYWPYKSEQMHWLCKPSEFVRTHHVHMIPIGSRLYRERLAFRDCLRCDPTTREAYAALKMQLATLHRHDREAYTEAKWPFVRDVLARALG